MFNRIRKVSKKKSKEDREYSKLRKDYLSKNPMCHAVIHECMQHATEVHHKKGRGIYYLDIATWLPVCRNCHQYIELHPIEAKELGFSEKRYGNN